MLDTHLTAEQGRQALISAENLTVRFGGLPAIEDVNVSIGAGEIVTLIGPNGAGKSTLVRALLGLIAPTDGTITRRTDVRIGYVPQHVSVDDTSTGKRRLYTKCAFIYLHCPHFLMFDDVVADVVSWGQSGVVGHEEDKVG